MTLRKFRGPVLQRGGRLEGTVAAITAASADAGLTHEIVVLDDGSDDCTFVFSVNQAWYDLYEASIPPNTPLLMSCAPMPAA